MLHLVVGRNDTPRRLMIPPAAKLGATLSNGAPWRVRQMEEVRVYFADNGRAAFNSP
jgi:hypothetical protein